MVIDKTLIEDIKSSTNIVDVIGEVVSLNRAGRNYLGLCPFHKEKTPSFNVIEDRQFYHCFGCHKGEKPGNKGFSPATGSATG